MTDIHAHLIYNVDDGSQSIEESIELLKRMKELGFDNVIITPHYIQGNQYNAENAEKREKLKLIQETLKDNEIDINTYLGNEIFINSDIYNLVLDKKISTMNNSRYILVEFPFYNQILNMADIIYELKCKGFKVIVAHPERYTYLQDDYKLVDELKEDGILFQCNYASILGYYTKNAEKLMKYMLKKEYVDFLGTDIHSLKKTYTLDNFEKIKKHIIKIAGKDYFNKIINNCDKIINDEDL